MDRTEKDRFIKICDNRIDHAKIFLKQVTTSSSILIDSFLIILSILMKDLLNNASSDHLQKYLILVFFKAVGWEISVFVVFVFIIIILQCSNIVYYRAETQAWYVFKEGALLMQEGKEEESEDRPGAGGSGNCP
jgi:hypothetical protein